MLFVIQRRSSCRYLKRNYAQKFSFSRHQGCVKNVEVDFQSLNELKIVDKLKSNHFQVGTGSSRFLSHHLELSDSAVAS